MDSIIAILGILAVIVGAVLLVINIVRKNGKKVPVIILGAGVVLFLIGAIMGTAAVEKKNAAESGYTIVETTKKDKIKQNYYRVTLKNTSKENIKDNLDTLIKKNDDLNSMFVYFHETPSKSDKEKFGKVVAVYKHAYTDQGALQIGADKAGETIEQ
ncbi:hypothetical protein EP56_05510 [Listeriaceae bacterium FSL A5-0209]|nr:hypothetical protein EP56_05510 [Listeriaceae bacterium FSL A5-0209]